jgi:hypothetical protein
MTCLVAQELCITRGDYKAYTLTFTDEFDVPVDISATTLWMTIKVNEDDADVVAAYQGSVVFPSDANSVAGTGTFELEHDDTKDLDPDIKYYYDFQWINAAGKPKTIGKGRMKVARDITVSIV